MFTSEGFGVLRISIKTLNLIVTDLTAPIDPNFYGLIQYILVKRTNILMKTQHLSLRKNKNRFSIIFLRYIIEIWSN